MLEWFISKIGTLIFVVVVLSAILLFSAFQISLVSQTSKVQEANAIARLIDAVCGNCSVSHTFAGNYTIIISEKSISLDGIVRGFSAKASGSTINSKKIFIKKLGGIIYVKGA